MRTSLGPVPWALAWVPFFLLLINWVQPGHSDYFVSNAECGFASAAQDFVNFEQSPQLSGKAASVGICNWGITTYTYTRADDFAGKCLACTFVPYNDRRLCPSGWRLNTAETWMLARTSECAWSSGCLGLPCPNNTVEGETAACGAGAGVARSCCPLKAHLMCCQALECSRTSSTSSGCVIDDKSLTPGQVASTIVYAVPAASSLCSTYSFSVQRTCLSNRTLSTGNYYDTCTTTVPGSDDSGCPVLAGYDRVPQQTYMVSSEAVLEDGTPWDALPSSSRAAAAVDPQVMASRCDRSSDCAAFDLSGLLTLRSYVPATPRWRPSNGSRCSGTYVKQRSAASCPRVHGYLFTQGASWTDASGALSTSVCTTCGVSQRLASACDADSQCAAFSSMHGVLTGLSPAAATQQLQQLDQFTATPCKGLFVRVGAQAPREVETLDRLLCGDSTYCQPSLQYSWRSVGQWVDVNVTLTSTLAVPPWLLYPNEATLAALPRIPNLRRLQLVCQPGMKLQGGLPRQLLYLLPSLQQLLMPGCGVAGSLAADLPSLAPSSLHVLDLSSNDLVGPLPPAWGGAWEMSMLNLSSNQLTGSVPSSWVSLPRTASSLDWGSAGEPQEAAAALNVVDISHNNLEGPVPRSIITDTCLYGSMRLEFDTVISTSSGMASYRAAGQTPMLALYANPELRVWTGAYLLATSQRLYSHQESKDNLCGNYGYIIALSIMWGGFFLVMMGILGWWLWRRQRQRAAHLARQQLTKSSGSPTPDDEAQTTQNPVAAVIPSPQSTGSSLSSTPSWWDRHWSQLWVRQIIFLARLAILVADMVLDVLVVMWLWQDGERTEAAVCIAFISLAQAVVAMGVFVGLVAPAFPSVCTLLLGGPPLLAVTPAIAPIMAVWNMWNPSIPLVSWRYLELQEFSIMLFQAPAQSVTKSIIYAQQSKLGGGMYIDNSLFIASIVLSLTDMAISVFKLARYKRGPWLRVRNAFSHLDHARDVTAYESLDDTTWYESDKPGSRYTGSSPQAEAYRLAFISAKKQQVDLGVSMRNPLLAGEDVTTPHDPFGSPFDGAQSRSNTAGGASRASPGSSVAHVPPTGEIQPFSGQGFGGGALSSSGPLMRLSRNSTTSMMSAHSTASAWSPSLPMPPPPSQTSLLQQSSLRLAVNTAMEAITASMPVAQPLSRSPSGGRRRSSGLAGSYAGVELLRTSSSGPKPKPPSQRVPATAPAPGNGGLRVSASGPSIGRSPLGKRPSNVGEDEAPTTTSRPQNLIPAYLPASRCSTPDLTPSSPVMHSPRVSSGHTGPGASEVVLGLFRRVNSQEASSTYHSATSNLTSASAMQTPSYSATGSPVGSRRNSHAGPSGQLHVHISGDGQAGSPGTIAQPWPPVDGQHGGTRPASPGGRNVSPTARLMGARSPSPVAGGSPLASAGPSGLASAGPSAVTGVSLEGLFSAPSPSLVPSMRPPLPPKAGTPRGRPTSAQALPSSPRQHSAFALPAAQQGPSEVSVQNSGDSSSSSSSSSSSGGGRGERFQAMPSNRHQQQQG